MSTTTDPDDVDDPDEIDPEYREAVEWVIEHTDGPLAEVAEAILHSTEDEEVSRS